MSPTTFPPDVEEVVEPSTSRKADSKPQVHLKAGSGAVVEKETKKEQESPSTKHRDHVRRRSLAPIREGNVSLEVPVSEEVHHALAALAKLEGTNGQRYNSRILTEHVARQPQERIELGKKLLEESANKTPRAKIRTLEERVKVLEKQLEQSGSRTSRR